MREKNFETPAQAIGGIKNGVCVYVILETDRWTYRVGYVLPHHYYHCHHSYNSNF